MRHEHTRAPVTLSKIRGRQPGMGATFGVLRVLSADADAGRPPRGQWLPEHDLAFPIAQEETLLGRDIHNAIVFFDPTISREHACLRYRAGIWTIENLSTTSGLSVEGKSVESGEIVTIAPGQRFQMGLMELQLVAPDLPLSIIALAEGGANRSHSATATLLRPGMAMRMVWHSQLRGGWSRLSLVGLIVLFCAMLALVAVVLTSLITHRALTTGTNVLAAIFLPLIPVVGILALVALIDRYEQRPWYLMLAAFLWGAVIAIPPALFVQDSLGRAINMLPLEMLPGDIHDIVHSALLGLNAGFTEEIAKGTGLIVLMFYLRPRFQNVTDGILYGVLIGGGFAMIENVVYFANYNSRNALVSLIIGRVILGWLGHSTFTACFGAALGFIQEHRRVGHPWRFALLGLGVSIGLHSLFDFVAFQASAAVSAAPASAFVNALVLLAVILDYVPLFAVQAILYVILMRSLAREGGIVRDYLVEEVQRGLVMPDEYVLLQRASVRQRIERAFLIGRGIPFWSAARALYGTEATLAFAKWQTQQLIRLGETDLPPIGAYRSRIRRLRRVLTDLDAEHPQGRITAILGNH